LGWGRHGNVVELQDGTVAKVAALLDEKRPGLSWIIA
jgi:hypothetical protein